MSQQAPVDAPPPFDLFGPLPTGTVVLEASAGTGKTHTIATLAARYVAQGTALEDLLIVTFSRAATDELRERVRRRMQELLVELGAQAGTDLETRRLREALDRYDAAVITTTHGMCQQFIAELGFAADLAPGSELVEDSSDLMDQVVADLYLYRHRDVAGEVSRITPEQVGQLAAEVDGSPDAQVSPAAEPDQLPSLVAERVWFANWVRRGLRARRQHFRLLNFDDLMLVVQDALRDNEIGDLARARLRRRHRVVLVDEFQDTDAVQWEILSETFHGHSTLILVGDPKQAIYGFRGGDVEMYLRATAEAADQQTLATNHRSDQPLVDTITGLLGDAALGHPQIRVRPVAARHLEPRIGHPDWTPELAAPIQLRWFGEADLQDKGRDRFPSVAVARHAITRDLVAQARELLSSGMTWGTGADRRPVQAGDIAVLVRTKGDAERIRQALIDGGIPAVLAATGSVFATPIAAQWLTVFEAMENLRDNARVRAAALTVFGGWDLARLATADDDAVETWRLTLRRWARVLDTQGMAALTEVIMSGTALAARLSADPNPTRALTDLRHVSQLLHEQNRRTGWGTAGLAGWLGEQVRDAARLGNKERSRRLETDAAAVQIATLHASKGLEFPVVLIPTAWDRYVRPPQKQPVLAYHEQSGDRVLFVGGESAPGFEHAVAKAREEEDGEDLRLFYVGITRASARVVLWWAPTANTPTSALHRVLMANRGLQDEVPASAPVPSDEAFGNRLASWSAMLPGLHAVRVGREPVPQRVADPGATELGPDEPLAVRAFDRTLDPTWRRTSYTALTADAHHGPGAIAATTEPEGATDSDEPLQDPELGEPADPAEAIASAPVWATPSPMAGLASGAAFGVVAHAVLENVEQEPGEGLQEAIGRAVSLAGGPAELVDPLALVLQTPLGSLFIDDAAPQGRTLASFTARDRLSELDFELPLAGGDRAEPGTGLRLPELADLLTTHLPADDALGAYPERLRSKTFQQRQLRGYLTGSIDSVLRLRGADGPRYVVVDYKTNWLGAWGTADLTLADYRQERLVQSMMDSHYPLQALLYCVALHRFLRWRQPGYDPERHLGGVAYLYLRGMAGPDTPTQSLADGSQAPAGVFSWQPPAGMVTALSDHLHTGSLGTGGEST